MRIFIDGLNLLRIESTDLIYQIKLDQNKTNWLKNDGFNQFFSTEKPITLHKADQIEVNQQTYPLELGVVCITKEFEKKYRYDGKLGYDYHPTFTTFTLFSPVAKEVFVVIDYKEYPMVYQDSVWCAKIEGNQEGLAYHYKIRLVDQFKIVKDPYAIATNLKDNIIIDLNKTMPMIQTPIKVKNFVDAVIYEGHVRNLSIGLDVESKGLFEGLIEPSKKLKGSVIQYIKKLGMTHLQLLPVFDFVGVDDIKKGALYNWGYNPSQYFCVDGWYSKNPDDPYDRINGLKKVVNHAHENDLGVIMDVVYNHVYDHLIFPYDDIVPGYFYRHTHQFHMTHACYLDNDVETRNYMVRKLIVDNLIHFATVYKMDGFRFDLMGLLDIETMLKIEKELKKVNPYIMLYGEGWNMPNEVSSKHRSNLSNQALFPSIGHFNDAYRDVMKGELHGPGLGYTMGNHHLQQKAMEAVMGSPLMFTSPNQSLNYIECHDNMTYYDKMLLNYGYENPEYKVCQDFANQLIAISNGVPFYHAGQEFYRSKNGIENSYDSPDEINQIHWHVNEAGVKKLKELLKLRKKYKLYRQTSYNEHISITNNGHLLIYKLENDKEIIINYIKNTFVLEKLPLQNGKKIFESQKTIQAEAYLFVDKPGVYIIYIKK